MNILLNLKEHISIDLNYNKTEFLKRLEKIVDYDKGIFKDELYKSSKAYIGKINSENFTLRKKRKFMNPKTTSSNANGKIIELKDGINLDIELIATDQIAKLALITAPIFFLFLIVMIIITQVYPILIIVIPISILFIVLPRIKMRKDLIKFKTELADKLISL